MMLFSMWSRLLCGVLVPGQGCSYSVAIAIMPGRRFWSEWTHDVTNIARQKPRLRQVRYEHEKTKKGQIMHNPQANAANECSTAQTHADIAASGTSRFVRNESIQRMGTISKVSSGGPISTIIGRRNSGFPSKVGPLSSVMIPDDPRMTAIIIDGKKLISPARSAYLRIEIRLSKSFESNHPRWISGSGIACCSTSCSGSKCRLPEAAYYQFILTLFS